jgi:FAD/FMN-containing dehydrogenase
MAGAVAPKVALDDATIQQLNATLRGELITPGDPGYDEARTIWNAMVDKRPAAIARCTGVADVIDVVNFARRTGAQLSVRGGGHNISGTSLCDGGVVADLSQMKGIRVDLKSETVRAQPGLRLGDLDRETQAFGRVVPAGIVTDTGIAGLTLGGGFGWLTRKWGFTSDNLLSVDVVTADGRFLTASATENADLFWGVRGGGGNFGIVTSFEYRMWPLGPEVMAGLVLYPMEKAADVIKFYREFTTSAPDELASLLMLRIAPPSPVLPKEVHGQPVAGIAVCYAGPVEEGERAVRPLKEFGAPIVDLVRPTPFTAHQALLDASQPPGRYYYWKSEYLPGITDPAQETLIAHTAELPSPESALLVFQLGGAVSRINGEDSAAAHRDAAYVLNIAGSCVEPQKTQSCIRWAREFWSDMRQFSTGGVYVNFMTEDEGEDRIRAAYSPAKYDRLVALKNKYDPTNLFSTNQNIKPNGTREK